VPVPDAGAALRLEEPMKQDIPCARCAVGEGVWLIHDGFDSKIVCKDYPGCQRHPDSEESKIAARYAEIVAAEEKGPTDAEE
jgi:hypothetical protein